MTIAIRQARSDSAAGDAIRQMMPAAVGVVPFAIMIGVAIGESPLSDVVGFFGGLIVAGGSAHLAAAGSISAGAGLAATVTTALLVNARGLLYGAALAPDLRDQPTWFRWVAAYGLVDQMYALVSSVTSRGAEYVRSFYLAAMTLLFGTYMAGVGTGLLLGPVIPAWVPLSLSIPIMFTAMLAPTVEARPAMVAAVAGAGVTMLGAQLPSGMGLVAGIVAGALSGAAIERFGDA